MKKCLKNWKIYAKINKNKNPPTPTESKQQRIKEEIASSKGRRERKHIRTCSTRSVSKWVRKQNGAWASELPWCFGVSDAPVKASVSRLQQVAF